MDATDDTTAGAASSFGRNGVRTNVTREGLERAERAADHREHECAERAADHREHERAVTVEHVLADVETSLDDPKYPFTSEALAELYAGQPSDLPNGTETVGDVFDRVGRKFDWRREVREALYGEIVGEATGPEEYNPQRELDAPRHS